MRCVEQGHARLRVSFRFNGAARDQPYKELKRGLTLPRLFQDVKPSPRTCRMQPSARLAFPTLLGIKRHCCFREVSEESASSRHIPSRPALLQPRPCTSHSAYLPKGGAAVSSMGSKYSKPRAGDVICPFMEISPKAISALLRACSFDAGDCVYDIGCGKGNIAAAVLDHYPCRVVAVEVNASLARHARHRLKKYGDRAQVLMEDVCKIDMYDATVVITSFLSNALQKVSSHMALSLRPGCIWLNHTWPIPGWSTSRPASDGVYTYVIGSYLWDGFERFQSPVANQSIIDVAGQPGSYLSKSDTCRNRQILRPLEVSVPLVKFAKAAALAR